MADTEDDLDAFFDDVDKVVEEEQGGVVATATDDTDLLPPPPAKKPKIARGIVVAAASAAAASTAVSSLQEPVSLFSSTTPPPPPPPPASAVPPPPPPSSTQTKTKKPVLRHAAGKTWEDLKLADWPDDDFRLFVGNLGNEVTDDMLLQHFADKLSTVQRVIIIREISGNSKGYGFVSFADPMQFAKALREMDQTWLGARPIRVKKSLWQDRQVNDPKKQKQQAKTSNNKKAKQQKHSKR